MLKWHRLAAAFLFLQGIQAFGIIDRLVYGEWDGKPGDKITQSLNLLVILLSIALFARRAGRVRTVGRGAVFLFIIIGFLTCSAAWSIDFHLTIREAFLYLVAAVGWVAIATNLEPDEFMAVAARMTFLAAAASIVLLVVSPSNALETWEVGVDFRGIFSQKNVLGEAMAVGAIVNLHCLSIPRKGRAWYGFYLAVIILVALMSKSATSCLAIFVCCVAHTVISPIRRGGAARVMGVAVLACILPLVLVATAFSDSILELLGKDPTLTGRTEIWAYVISDIQMKPLLGWGYEAFWGDNPAAKEISDAVHWVVPQAHNGLLELLVEIGLVGTTLFVALLVRIMGLAVRCLPSPSAGALGVSTLLVCAAAVMLTGVSEAVLLAPFAASTTMFMISGLFCERALYAARRRRQYPVARPNAILWPVQTGPGP